MLICFLFWDSRFSECYVAYFSTHTPPCHKCNTEKTAARGAYCLEAQGNI